MILATAVVLHWEGLSGQVIRHDEIWQVQSAEPITFLRGDRVLIDSLSGLTLSVKSQS
jgi:membrane-bound ClpP family serine protease